MQSSKTGNGEKSQAERFIETARQLECDEDKGRFEEKLGKIARHRPGAEARSKERPRES